MSEENGKVCCNCRHNIRKYSHERGVECWCNVDEKWLSYVTVMSHWCRHWAKEKPQAESKVSDENSD